MWKVLLVGVVLIGQGCVNYHHPTASLSDQKRDEVECRALASQGAGPPAAVTYVFNESRLLKLCLESRGWVKE